jgi:hypothetical protein
MADNKNDNTKEGFLGRWSQRKQDIRAGKHLVEPEIAVKTIVPINHSNVAQKTDKITEQKAEITASEEKPEVPLPTMADVHQLTAESDFSPFLAKNVSSEVRNSAMKKLFTDPHYNVMDRLDIYIDDYSQPDPIPESMLRQLASAKFLNLFKAEEEAEAKEAAEKAAAETNTRQSNPIVGDDADTASMQSVAQSNSDNLPTQTIATASPISGPNNDHSDLRLQQNHTAGPKKPGNSAE